MISCIVPAYNEEKFIGATLQSLLGSKKECLEEVEIIVVDNHSTDGTLMLAKSIPDVKCLYFPIIGREKAKNFGASTAKGETLVFIDADCLVTKNFFQEISEKAQEPYFVGGGVKHCRLTRYSLGIVSFMCLVAVSLVLNQITVGAFWVRKNIFNELEGFRLNNVLDDIDFAIRLKKYAKEHGRKFESLKECVLTWSTRRFDESGDWGWLRNTKSLFA